MHRIDATWSLLHAHINRNNPNAIILSMYMGEANPLSSNPSQRPKEFLEHCVVCSACLDIDKGVSIDQNH